MDNNFSQTGASISEGSMTQDAKILEQMPNFEPHNKILLIEDNPGDARLVEILLSESDLGNCKITIKANLADGMALLEESDDFAAILLDLTLPDSRGFETLETLLSKFPDNNVIVLTGLQDKSLGINSVKAGAQDFLIKGAFDSDQLSKSLRYSIERSMVLKRLEETQRIANIGNWEYNSTTEEFLASGQIYSMFDLKPRKTVLNYIDILKENHPFKELNDIHQEALANLGTDIRKDIRIEKNDGSVIYVYVQCKASITAESAIMVVGIMQDITERKSSEEALVQSQAKYLDIFNKSKDPIYICTFDGKCEVFNEALESLLGFTKEEIEQTNIHNLFRLEKGVEDFFAVLKRNKNVKDFEVTIERKDGETRYCLLNATMLDSETPSYNGVIRDITARKQAETLRKARDLAQTSAKMKEKFIASISHEMRTPMNAILGMSNLVIQTDLDPEQSNYISSIKQSSELLLGIINDILEISTLENGKIAFENKDFDLVQLLDNLVNVMKYKVEEKALQLIIDIDKNVPQYIKGDKLRLNQVLYNLVGNAIKFTDKGKIHVRIANLFDDDSDNVFLKFEVEDTGIGIPKDKVAAVFDTFTRVRTKDRIYEGTGLGLSIAKNLVEQQGGKIDATSIYGEGSTFFFDLVFDRGSQNEAKAPTPELDDTIHLDRPVRLLLVEDNKLNQMVAKKTLQKKWPEMDITIADNGKLGVEAVKEKKFDIILMDIQMPIMDGYEATQYIRKNMPPEIANMPILAMTAHANISKDHSYREYGMDDFVLKPFKPEQLFGKIAQHVNKSK